jgi:hypothetical protein
LIFNYKNIILFKQLLFSLNKLKNFYTNHNSSIHIHISFEHINEKDLFWLVCNIAYNDEILSILSGFNDENSFIHNLFSNKDVLNNLREKIIKKDVNSIKSIYYDLLSNKLSLLAIRPMFKTLEWRGPRDFLNNLDKIELFVKNLIKFIDFSKKVFNKNTINGISRKEIEQINDLEIINNFFKKLNVKFRIKENNGITIIIEIRNQKVDFDNIKINIENINQDIEINFHNCKIFNLIVDNIQINVNKSTINNSIIYYGAIFNSKINNTQIISSAIYKSELKKCTLKNIMIYKSIVEECVSDKKSEKYLLNGINIIENITIKK